MFIKLTSEEGAPVLLNSEHVSYVSGSTIWVLGGGHYGEVAEGFEEISRVLSQAYWEDKS